ncbi:MAG: hypothetical protein IK031_01165 [Bacteroidales bacterium]|nr:hypothetical protein [Bacteroidales bacterium]
MTQVLHSKYVIDGVPQELTPAEILSPVMEKPLEPGEPGPAIVDETFDPAPFTFSLESSRIGEYLGTVLAQGRHTPVPFASQCARARIATAIIDTVWRSGNFRLDDLALTAKWSFNPDWVGDMAAFYASVEAVADYVDTLRVSIRRIGCERGRFDLRFSTPFSGAPLLVDDAFHPDAQSWIAYVPFDTSDYRLGGSQLACGLGFSGGVCPQVDDPDYLMDCFEVVRELAEDGVLLSASTVSSGGIISALERMRCPGAGCTADISGIMSASGETDPVRILFSEVPGAVIQIRDTDFDYVDAEFLLQDVAWFPLGHPSPDGQLHLATTAKSGIQTILESLMQNAEGED